ncbi:MAG: ABC transporter permease [Clostridium septicum]|uniref:ABC transporter permease n=1 Tax=Clostridium septicum TaxID=1504 RepID=UPI00258A3AFB|nr:ABC transporter permease [Clostridium septicum]MDU1314348.1 ABC transporter permease [Clostridium septicum]
MKNKSITKLFINKNFFVNLFIILELSLLILFIYTIQTEIRVKKYVDNLDNYYWNSGNSYSIYLNPEEFHNNSGDLGLKINDFYNKLKSSNKIEDIGLIYTSNGDTSKLSKECRDYIYIPYSKLGEILHNQFDNDTGLMPIRFVNYDYIKGMNINVETGSIFTKEEQKESTNYTILGHKFRKFFNLNEKIQVDNYDMIVKGIGKQDIPFFFDKDYAEAYPFLDNSMIILINSDMMNNLNFIREAFLKGGLNIKFKDDKVDGNKEYVRKLAIESGLDIGMRNNFIMYEDATKVIKSEIKFSFIRTIIFLFSSLIAISTINIYTIYDFKKEFGIMISLGAKKIDIFKIVFIKNTIITILAFTLGTILSYKIKLAGNGWYAVDIKIINILISFFILIIIMSLSMLMPIYKILKIEPRELIGGER